MRSDVDQLDGPWARFGVLELRNRTQAVLDAHRDGVGFVAAAPSGNHAFELLAGALVA